MSIIFVEDFEGIHDHLPLDGASCVLSGLPAWMAGDVTCSNVRSSFVPCSVLGQMRRARCVRTVVRNRTFPCPLPANRSCSRVCVFRRPRFRDVLELDLDLDWVPRRFFVMSARTRYPVRFDDSIQCSAVHHMYRERGRTTASARTTHHKAKSLFSMTERKHLTCI